MALNVSIADLTSSNGTVGTTLADIPIGDADPDRVVFILGWHDVNITVDSIGGISIGSADAIYTLVEPGVSDEGFFVISARIPTGTTTSITITNPSANWFEISCVFRLTGVESLHQNAVFSWDGPLGVNVPEPGVFCAFADQTNTENWTGLDFLQAGASATTAFREFPNGVTSHNVDVDGTNRWYGAAFEVAPAGSIVHIQDGLLIGDDVSFPFVGSRPFHEQSHWNHKLTEGVPGDRSQAGVADSYIVFPSTWVDDNDWSCAIYHATEEDPLQDIIYHIDSWNDVAGGFWLRSGNSSTIEDEILTGTSNTWEAQAQNTFPTTGLVFASQSASDWIIPEDRNVLVNPDPAPRQIRVPANAVPADGWDGHMAIYQPDGTVVDFYAAIRIADGPIVCLSYSIIDPADYGDGWWEGQRASMLPSFAGVITKQEINDGLIPHALTAQAPPALLDTEYVYPAYTFDRDATTNTPAYSGTVPMGGKLALPPTFDIGTLNLQTSVGETLAQCCKDYGVVLTDRGGSGITLLVEVSDEPSDIDTWSQAQEDDIAAIFDNLELVSNLPVPAGSNMAPPAVPVGFSRHRHIKIRFGAG